MKTEQEQIEAIKQIIDERVETTLGQVQGRHDNVIKTVDTVIIARDIVNAGYGDVSEYKAEREMLGSQIKVLKQRLNNKYIEVEKLKAENEKLKTKCDDLKKLSDWQREEIKILKAEVNKGCDNCETIKQGQVDVLNELKGRVRTSYVLDDFILGNVVFSKDIDELIKEVQNVEDKG